MSVCSSITRTKLVVPDRRKMLLLSQEVGIFLQSLFVLQLFSCLFIIRSDSLLVK